MSSRSRLNGNSLCRRLTFQPDLQDVSRRIYIPIMGCTTARTNPRPYSKRAHTFRAAAGNNPAARARLGSPSFVGLNIYSLPSGSLIPQHMSERRPASIQDRLCHLGFCKLRCAHVSNNDKSVLTHNLGRLFMKMMTARVGDFGVYRLSAGFISGPVRLAEIGFILPIMANGWDSFSRAKRREPLKAKINPNCTASCYDSYSHFILERDVPAPSRILDEGAALVSPFDFTRLPNSEPPFEINDGCAVNGNCPGYKGYPSKRPLGSIARTEARAFSMLISSSDKLTANRLDSIGMDAKVATGSCGKFDKVVCSWPKYTPATPSASLRFALRGNAKIPDLIARYRVATKDLSSPFVLDSKFKSQKRHTKYMQNADGFCKGRP